MKPNIHPDYHPITLIMTNGTKVQTKSTYGKAGDSIQLDTDTFSHPAWTKGVGVVNSNVDSIAKFNTRFAGLSFGKKAEAAAPAAAEAKAADAAPAAKAAPEAKKPKKK